MLKTKKTSVWINYLKYLNLSYGWFGIALIILLFVLAQASLLATDYWLFKWASNDEINQIKLKKLNSCANAKSVIFIKNCSGIFGSINKMSNKTFLSQLKVEHSNSFKIYSSNYYSLMFLILVEIYL